MRLKENVLNLTDLLTSGKKVTVKQHKLMYSEDFNDKSSGMYTSEKIKYTAIEYFYVNPQFNRVFAYLEDGRTVDYDLPYMRCMWNEFVEYVPPKPPKRKMTLSQIESKLGYEIDLLV